VFSSVSFLLFSSDRHRLQPCTYTQQYANGTITNSPRHAQTMTYSKLAMYAVLLNY